MAFSLWFSDFFLQIFRFLPANFQIFQIWPFRAKKACFRALLGPPGDISGWSKRLKLTPPDVKYNVQPCSTNVQPIWACWDRLWPIMAFLGKKWQFLAIKPPKTTEIWWAQGWTSISPTQETIWMHWFLQNQTFFWPPPLKHIVLTKGWPPPPDPHFF